MAKPTKPDSWAQMFENIEKHLDEAADEFVVRPKVAMHHLMLAVSGLGEIVKEHVQDET